MQRNNLCSPLNWYFTWLWHIVHKLRNLLKKQLLIFQYLLYILYEYFANTVSLDFQKSFICKHSLNHKSTCDQSDCSMHSPTNTAILCFIHGVRSRWGRGGGRPPRFWRKFFQYIPPPPDFGGFCSEMF